MSNTVVDVYLRKLSRNWDKIFSTAQFIFKMSSTRVVLEITLNFGTNFLNKYKKNCIATSHFYAISSDKNQCLAICQYRSCLLITHPFDQN